MIVRPTTTLSVDSEATLMEAAADARLLVVSQSPAAQSELAEGEVSVATTVSTRLPGAAVTVRRHWGR